MAYTTGTATGYLDLLGKLRDFLTTNTALVNAGQQWQVIGGVASGTPVSGDYISFKGPGLTGTDQVLCTIATTSSVSGGYYNWRLYGHTGYNTSLPGPVQSGGSPAGPAMLLTNNSFAYWFIANGRCFKVVTRISGRYDAIYLGLLLPDHTPQDYPYPMYVGGSASSSSILASNDTLAHCNFWVGSSYDSVTSNAYVLTPGSAWRKVVDSINDSTGHRQYGMHSLPWNNYIFQIRLRRPIDDSGWLMRGTLAEVGEGSGVDSGGAPTTDAPDGGLWVGSYDGVFYTPSFGATAEEIITLGSTGHLLLPNIARTGSSTFAALALE